MDKIPLDTQVYNIHNITTLDRVLLYSSYFTESDILPLDRPLSLYDFKDYDFLVVSDDEIATSVKSVVRQCTGHGFDPKIRLVPNIASMVAGVQNGVGVAIADEWTGITHGDLRLLHLKGLPHNVRLAWRKGSPEYIDHFASSFLKLVHDDAHRQGNSWIL